MARKKRSVRSLMGEGVVSDGAKKFKIYNKPLMICTTIQIRSQCNPFILPRCLSYRIQAKKQKKSNSSGGAIFNYMDSKNNILKAEDVKDYSCTFCSMKCGSLEGLKLHLTSSHDIFEYNFRLWNKDHPTIDVSLKPVAFKFGELRKSLENHHGIPFTFWSKRQRRQRDDRRHLLKLERKIEDIKFTQLEPLPRKRKRTSLKESKGTSTDNQLEIGQCSKSKEPLPCRRKKTSAKQSKDTSTDNQLEIGQCSKPKEPLPRKRKRTSLKRFKGTRRKRTPAKRSKGTSTDNQLEIGQCSKPKEPLPCRRKRTPAKRSNGISTDRLKKLHFHNFMTGQPMTIELALAGEDSEAKPADEFKDMEERWTPDTYTDTKDEDKRIMFLWNSFARKKRVLADRDVPGACEAFVNNHEKELISTSQYFVQWRVFMLNLWNKGLICAKTMDKCNAFLLKSQEAAEAEAEAAVPSSSTSQATAADRNEQQPMELDHSNEKAAAASLLLLSSAVPSQATADRNGKQL